MQIFPPVCILPFCLYFRHTKISFSEVNLSLWFLRLVVCLGLSRPKLYKYSSIISCDTHMVSFFFFLHLNVIQVKTIQVELMVQCVYLGAGLMLSEPPELAPFRYPPPCGQMMEWQSPVNHKGCHNGTGSLEKTLEQWVLSPSGILVAYSPWLPVPHPNWFGPVAVRVVRVAKADVDRPGSTPHLATWQLFHWEWVPDLAEPVFLICEVGVRNVWIWPRCALTVIPSSVLLLASGLATSPWFPLPILDRLPTLL